MIRRNSFFVVFISVFTALFFVVPITHSFKVVHYSTTIGAAIFYMSTVFYFIVLSLSFIINLDKIAALKYSFMTGLFCIMIVFALAITIFYGGEIEDIAGNMLRYLNSFLIYLNARIFPEVYANLKLKNRLIKFGFIGTVTALIIVYYNILTGGNVYLGLSTENLIPFIANNLKNNPFNVLLGLVMIVMGGKRGMILSSLLGLMIFLVFKQTGTKKAIPLFFTLLIPIVGIWITIQDASILKSLPKTMQNRVAPFVINSDKEQFNIRNATAGRNEEVETVIRIWKQDPLSAIVGRGYGAAFQLSGEDMTDSTVHISPIGVAFISGIPLTLFLYGYLIYVAFRSIKQIKHTPEYTFWYYIFISLILNSFSVFIVFQAPLIWLSLAQLERKKI